MRGTKWSPVLLFGLGCLVAAAVSAQPPVVAEGTVELTDPEGDMSPISTSDGSEPALDLVGLTIRSDGRRIALEATLAGPPGTFASSVADVLIDSDLDPATGIGEFRGHPPGFDFQASVVLCMAYDNGGKACAGGMGDAVTERWGALELERFEGDHPYGPKETIVSALAFPGERASEKTPVSGQKVTAFVDYADLGVASGQKIRLLALESGGSPTDDGAFPIVLLTLE